MCEYVCGFTGNWSSIETVLIWFSELWLDNVLWCCGNPELIYITKSDGVSCTEYRNCEFCVCIYIFGQTRRLYMFVFHGEGLSLFIFVLLHGSFGISVVYRPTAIAFRCDLGYFGQMVGLRFGCTSFPVRTTRWLCWGSTLTVTRPCSVHDDAWMGLFTVSKNCITNSLLITKIHAAFAVWRDCTDKMSLCSSFILSFSSRLEHTVASLFWSNRPQSKCWATS